MSTSAKHFRHPDQGGVVKIAVAASDGAPDRIDHSRPLREQVYAIVRRSILTGEFAPGTSIDEKALALKFGVSRTPVREAVKKLSDENLVEVKPQSSTIVACLDASLIREAFLIRRALEVENIAQAAAKMSALHKDRMDQLHFLHGRAIEHRRYVDAISWDDAFHRYISEISGLPRLWKAIEISKAQLDRCRHLTVPRRGRAQATLEQHRHIIEALATGDENLSRRVMGSHLDNSYLDIVKLLGSMSARSSKGRQADQI
jgi:GntR family transcriptional regulator, rspAB operon transcriptional repressor